MTTTYFPAQPATPFLTEGKLRWTGRVLSAIPVLFLVMDATMKLLQVPVAVQGTMKLGYPVGMIIPLGIIEAISLVLYLYRRTSLFGVVILTGYLGGAVATHVHAGDPLFSHILVPVYFATFLWGGLCLRDRRFRALLVTP
ncbi:MAG TPA: DoxX family protein [Thermoanaerobaculia bacterium]|jgi:hypothetical protein|nr:DoxX family protein [Thermoanaerobaculia bacterium]